MRKIIRAIIAGERNPVRLCCLVHKRTRNKHGEQVITDSLSGIIEQADVEMLIQSMEQIELFVKQQATCLNHLEELANQYFAQEISLLCTIPGIKSLSAMFILAEIGNDMSVFSKASSLVGWAGLQPRNEESAGKIRSRKTLYGNKYLRQILVEVTWAGVRTRQTFFQKKYYALSQRMKNQKALIAITRKMLVIIFNVLKIKQPFDPNRNIQAVTA